MKRKNTYRNPLKPFYPNLSKPRYVAVFTGYTGYEGYIENNSYNALIIEADNKCSFSVSYQIFDRHNEKQAKSLKEMGID